MDFDDFWSLITISVVTVFTVIFVYMFRRLHYWKNKGIQYVSGNFPFGSLTPLILQKVSSTELYTSFYNQTKGKYIGLYSFFNPQLLIKDLELVKNILVKDFSDFTNRGMYFDESVDPLSAHLFSLEGNQWRNLRAKLSPVYTSGKMKTMYSTVKECAMELQKYGISLVQTNDIVDLKDMTGRYGLDVITSTALGLKGNNFVDSNTDMRRVTSLVVAPSIIQMSRMTLALMCKTVAKLLRLRFVPKEVESYFMNIVKQNTDYRETNNIKRNDFMQLLIELRNGHNIPGSVSKINEDTGKESKMNLTLEEMAAQSFVFVAAGFETSSVTLGFCLYELARNPKIQDRLAKELFEAGKEDISYEALQQLTYLEMVLSETLRKYPPLGVLQRECSRDYTLPDGKMVNKGTMFIIPVVGFHQDPKFFPNPDVFDPERFNKDNIQKIAPYSYLPFGEGPRICIGMRFGKMQVKLALVALLSRFKVEVCNKTQIPIKIEKRTFTYNAEGGVWLRLKERETSAGMCH